MAKVSMYPTSIEQPNKNESSGLAGVKFNEIGRDGKVHTKNLRDLNDPKYFHEWKNTSNLKSGKEANCGNRSSYHCSHATYYGIKGYRNTCPIAGVTGTYTQPAALKLKFNPSKKGVSSTATIKSVKVTFKHRCVGVDVSNDATSIKWGPNFSGFKHYPHRKVIKANLGSLTDEWNINPPLSDKKYDTVSLKFKSTSKNKIKYKDLTNGLIIQYGNNLSTNPGNIYIKNLEISVEYEEGKIYIEGSQTNNSLYVSPETDCLSPITFKIEAGYKKNGIKMHPNEAPKKFQNNKLDIVVPNGVAIQNVNRPNDGKTITFDCIDKSNTPGDKQIYCTLNQVGDINFDYTAIKRERPKIEIPSMIEKNTAPNGIISIKAIGGCTTEIIAYDEAYPNAIYTFSTINVDNPSNLIPQNDIDAFYRVLSKLDCGDHTIYFRRGGEPLEEMPSAQIKIVPTSYTLKIYEITEQNPNVNTSNILSKTEVSKLEVDQNKYQNRRLLIEFIKTKDLLDDPVFSIINPTYGLNNTHLKISEDAIPFIPNKEGGSIRITAGTYFPGNYTISIKEPENCSSKETNLNLTIKPKHKQHFDEVFVRGEDSTAFDYDYLTVLEGDSLVEPLYVESVTLGASYKDIKICTEKKINTTINNPYLFPVKITNQSNNDIDNLFLELNLLTENEDGEFEVSTDEWINEDGAFYNFSQKFADYNENILRTVSIKNLSQDDDEIGEEDVYIHINKIYANQTITINIPIFSYKEKQIKMQMLLFEEIIELYNIENCSDEEDSFENIEINIFDAILTDMKITGDIDILKADKECPLECFDIKGITYKIKNIDSSDINSVGTIIDNDPRLIPYKAIDKEGNEIDFNTSPKLHLASETRERIVNIAGTKVSNTVVFSEDYSPISLKGYTNAEGYITFYITIPKSIGKSYTIDELESLCTITTDMTDTQIKVIDDFISYSPGQTVPLKVKVSIIETYFVNQFIFIPNILKSGAEDEVTVYYKVCNLKNNEGILKTIFKTDPQNYKLIKNQVEEDILCGVPTCLKIYPKLEKVIVEQTEYNRLHLTVKNKNRFNKDIKIHINELEDVMKYSYYTHNVETGDMEINNKEIIWNINYLDKNSTTKGYIDFKGDILGLSHIKITSEDFASNIDFNVIECECREIEEFTEE